MTVRFHPKRPRWHRYCACRATARLVSGSGTSRHRGSRARPALSIAGLREWALIASTGSSGPKHRSTSHRCTTRPHRSHLISVAMVTTSPKTWPIKRSRGCNVNTFQHPVDRSSVISQLQRYTRPTRLQRSGVTALPACSMRAGTLYVSTSLNGNSNSE